MTDRITTHPVVLRCLEVARVIDVTPRLRRVTLRGPELGAFTRDGIHHPPFRSDGPDDHVKAFFAAPGEPNSAVNLPGQADGHLDWPDDHSITDRDYTVRRFDPEAGELDLEFVLHGAGPASGWAASVTVGAGLHVAGPRTSARHPETAQLLLAGDETALPAIARWVEEAAAETAIIVLVEVQDAADEVALARPTGALEVTWVHRSRQERLGDALRALPAFHPDVYVFVAGEFSQVADARAHLRTERGLATGGHRATSYWRAGATELDDHLAEHRLEDLADLLTPHALRVAATLRLPDLVHGGVTTVAGLAEAVGGDADVLEALVAHLAGSDVFSLDPTGAVGLGPLGAVLLDAHPSGARRRLDRAGAEGHMDAAWAGLLHTTATGRSGYEQVHGVGFWDHLRADADLARSFDGYLARWAHAWVPLVRDGHDWRAYRRIVDVGGGMGILLAELLSVAPEATGTLVDLATTVATATSWFEEHGLADRATATAGDFFEALPTGDAVVLAQVIHDWPDAEATAILRRAADAAGGAGSDGRVLLVERLRRHAGADGPHAEMTLLMATLFAARERREDELVGLASAAGLAHLETTEIGLGLHLLQFGAGDPSPGSPS